MSPSEYRQPSALAEVDKNEETILCPGLSTDCWHQEELKELRHQVITDPLTSLYNTRYLVQALPRELERTERTGVPTSIMMLDLDYFKRVNDQYGHTAGDSLLKETADILKRATRNLDIQCRYGGEEFAVILPSTPIEAAWPIAERIRRYIAAAEYDHDNKTLRWTASIGIAEYTRGQKIDSEALIAQADSYLYEAKDAGRNCVKGPALGTSDSRVTADEKQMVAGLFADDSD